MTAENHSQEHHMETPEIEYVDRYTALGIQPNPATVCEGQCEGTGFVPIHATEQEAHWKALWDEAHAQPHAEPCDGTHFVKCPDCNGTGSQTVTGSIPQMDDPITHYCFRCEKYVAEGSHTCRPASAPPPPSPPPQDCMNYRGYGVVCLKGAGHDGACGGHLAGCCDGFDCGCPNEIHKPAATPSSPDLK